MSLLFWVFVSFIPFYLCPMSDNEEKLVVRVPKPKKRKRRPKISVVKRQDILSRSLNDEEEIEEDSPDARRRKRRQRQEEYSSSAVDEDQSSEQKELDEEEKDKVEEDKEVEVLDDGVYEAKHADEQNEHDADITDSDIGVDVQRKGLQLFIEQAGIDYEDTRSDLNHFMKQVIMPVDTSGGTWLQSLGKSQKAEWLRLSNALLECEGRLNTAKSALSALSSERSESDHEHEDSMEEIKSSSTSSNRLNRLNHKGDKAHTEYEDKPIKSPDNMPKWAEKENRQLAFNFIELFEFSMTGANIPQRYWPNQLLQAVQSLAHKRWVSKHIIRKAQADVQFTWTLAKQAFIDYFNSSDQRDILRDEYTDCHQGDHESAQDYGARFDQIRSRLDLDPDTQAVTMHFIDGLRVSTRKEFKKELARFAVSEKTKAEAEEIRGSLEKCMKYANGVERWMFSTSSNVSHSSGSQPNHSITSAFSNHKSKFLKRKHGLSRGGSSSSASSQSIQLGRARNMDCKPCAQRVRETGRFIKPHLSKDCRFRQQMSSSSSSSSSSSAVGTKPAEGRREQSKVVTCWKCGRKGHYANECPTNKNNDGIKGGASGSSRPPSAITSNGERKIKKTAVESGADSVSSNEDLLEGEILLEEGTEDSRNSSGHSSGAESDMISVDECVSRNDSDGSLDQMLSSDSGRKSDDEVSAPPRDGWHWVDRSLPEEIFISGDDEGRDLFAHPVIDAISARVALAKQATVHWTGFNEIENKQVATNICLEGKSFIAHLDSQASHS